MAKSWLLGYRLTDAFVDDAGATLVGVGQPVPPGQSGESPRYANHPGTTGDLYQFELPKP